MENLDEVNQAVNSMIQTSRRRGSTTFISDVGPRRIRRRPNRLTVLCCMIWAVPILAVGWVLFYCGSKCFSSKAYNVELRVEGPFGRSEVYPLAFEGTRSFPTAERERGL